MASCPKAGLAPTAGADADPNTGFWVLDGLTPEAADGVDDGRLAAEDDGGFEVVRVEAGWDGGDTAAECGDTPQPAIIRIPRKKPDALARCLINAYAPMIVLSTAKSAFGGIKVTVWEARSTPPSSTRWCRTSGKTTSCWLLNITAAATSVRIITADGEPRTSTVPERKLREHERRMSE